MQKDGEIRPFLCSDSRFVASNRHEKTLIPYQHTVGDFCGSPITFLLFHCLRLGTKDRCTIKDRNYEDKNFLVRIYNQRDGTPLGEMITITGIDIEAIYASPDTTIHIPLTQDQSEQFDIGRDLFLSLTVSNSDDTIAARGILSAKVVL